MSYSQDIMLNNVDDKVYINLVNPEKEVCFINQQYRLAQKRFMKQKYRKFAATNIHD